MRDWEGSRTWTKDCFRGDCTKASIFPCYRDRSHPMHVLSHLHCLCFLLSHTCKSEHSLLQQMAWFFLFIFYIMGVFVCIRRLFSSVLLLLNPLLLHGTHEGVAFLAWKTVVIAPIHCKSSMAAFQDATKVPATARTQATEENFGGAVPGASPVSTKHGLTGSLEIPPGIKSCSVWTPPVPAQ